MTASCASCVPTKSPRWLPHHHMVSTLPSHHKRHMTGATAPYSTHGVSPHVPTDKAPCCIDPPQARGLASTHGRKQL